MVVFAATVLFLAELVESDDEKPCRGKIRNWVREEENKVISVSSSVQS